MVRLACDLYPRRGQYRKETLIARFGGDALMPDVRHLIAQCPRKDAPSYAKLLRTLARADLLILDDWGPEQLKAEQRRDLLEIIEDRYDVRSLIITSQLPVERWYEIIGDPTLADAILDRIIHSAYRIALAGDSMRKIKAAIAQPETRQPEKEVSKSAKAARSTNQAGEAKRQDLRDRK